MQPDKSTIPLFSAVFATKDTFRKCTRGFLNLTFLYRLNTRTLVTIMIALVVMPEDEQLTNVELLMVALSIGVLVISTALPSWLFELITLTSFSCIASSDRAST